jgi:hypothetical protein
MKDSAQWVVDHIQAKVEGDNPHILEDFEPG